MNNYRTKAERIGEKNANSRLKPTKRLNDYDKVIALLNALIANESITKEKQRIQDAIGNAMREREIAETNIQKFKRGRLESHKL